MINVIIIQGYVSYSPIERRSQQVDSFKLLDSVSLYGEIV